MSDFALVDTRARAAGAALRDAAARRPVASLAPLALSNTGDSRAPRPNRLRPALIATVVVLLIAALVALTTRDPQPAQPTGPEDLRYIVAGLDQFWTVEGARDGGGIETDDLPGYFGTLYGTLGDPTRPGLLVNWVDAGAANTKPFNAQRFEALIGAANVEEFEVNGLPAGCGDRPTGETVCRVETEQGFVSTFSLGVPRTDLRSMLATVQHDGTLVTVDPTSVPSSLTEVTTGPFAKVIGFNVFAKASSAVRWTNSDGSAVNVTVVHDDGTRLTRHAVEPGWQKVRIDEVSGFQLDIAVNASTLTWLRDGKVFTVEATLGSNQSTTAGDLAMQFATSLRRASDADWSALPPWRDDPIDPGTEVTATSSTEATPSSVSVPGTGQGADVSVGLDSVALFGGEFSVRSTGPGVANDDAATIGMALDSFRIRAVGGSNGRPVGSETVLDVVPLDAFRGVYLLTDVDGELVVTGQDGTLYHATPQALFEGNDIRFAMVILPVNFVKAEFVAPDGTVLAEFDGFV